MKLYASSTVDKVRLFKLAIDDHRNGRFGRFNFYKSEHPDGEPELNFNVPAQTLIDQKFDPGDPLVVVISYAPQEDSI
jgi:hypothetical protein